MSINAVALDLAVDRLQVPAANVRPHILVEEDLGEAEDAGERCSQLVGDRRDQILARPGRRALRRHFPEDEDPSDDSAE